MLEWLKWRIAYKEMQELQNWRMEWHQHRRWFAEFPIAGFVLDRMQAKIDGEPLNSISDARDSWRKTP